MDSKSFRPPVILTGRFLELVPTERSHRVALHEAASDPGIGRYLVDGPGTTLDEVDALIELVLGHQDSGEALAFTVLRLPDRQPMGMTRFLNIDRPNDTVEVGGTWYASSLWRTPVNTESKLLLFRYAFESQGAHRVRLNTDLRNERSRTAIARLGATQEGVMREDRLLRSGYRRSSVAFSVLADEWPRVRARLEGFLARPWPAGRAGTP